ncbi:DUF6221 family protein [Nocardia sp. NPDC004260]
MTSDALDRLRAGLAEDERIARAATPGPWRYNPSKHHRLDGMPIGSGHAFEEAVFAGPTGADAVCVAGTGDSDDPQSMQDAEHIARQCPKATLDRVEAIREVIEAVERLRAIDNWRTSDIADDITASLASIYTEGCTHTQVVLESRSPVTDEADALEYRCEACGYTVLLNRLAGDEPTRAEVREAFRFEPTETGEPT